jgi:hypothetical protein
MFINFRFVSLWLPSQGLCDGWLGQRHLHPTRAPQLFTEHLRVVGGWKLEG